MGAFFGSIHVRSHDRAAVLAAADAVAQRLDLRMLASPERDGWVAIYPEGAGQNPAVSQELAAALPGHVFHMLLHDDDVVAYWLYHAHRLTDSYNSSPGYFSPVSEGEEAALRGNPAAFAGLLRGTEEELRVALQPGPAREVFASGRFVRIADVIGLPGAATAYEILKRGETEGLDGSPELSELPSRGIAPAAAPESQGSALPAPSSETPALHGGAYAIGDVIACSTGYLMVVQPRPGGEARIESLHCKTPLDGRTAPRMSLRLLITPDGSRLCFSDGQVMEVYDTETWNVLASWRPAMPVLAMHPAGTLLACLVGQKQISLRRIPDGEEVQRIDHELHPGHLGLVFHPNGEELLLYGVMNQAHHIAVHRLRPPLGQHSDWHLSRGKIASRGQIHRICFDSTGRWLLLGTDGGFLRYDWGLLREAPSGPLPKAKTGFGLTPVTFPMRVAGFNISSPPQAQISAIAADVQPEAFLAGGAGGRLFHVDPNSKITRINGAFVDPRWIIRDLVPSRSGKAFMLVRVSVDPEGKDEHKTLWISLRRSWAASPPAQGS